MIDNAVCLFPRFITKVFFVSCQNMRSLCPSHEIEGLEVLEILHLDGLIMFETLFEAEPSNNSQIIFETLSIFPRLLFKSVF